MKFRIRVRLKTLVWLLGLFSLAGLISLVEFSYFGDSHYKRDKTEPIATKNLQLRKINVESMSSAKSHEEPPSNAASLRSPVPLIPGANLADPRMINAIQKGGEKCQNCQDEHLPPNFLRFPGQLGSDHKWPPYAEILRNNSVAKLTQNESCGTKCKIERRRSLNRPLVENVELPEEWSASEDLLKRFQYRKQHVKEVCDKYGLSERSPTNQPNAWEYLINSKYNLIWCSIFKSASSTWFFNFNLLAGYSEKFLLTYRTTPISLARKKYPRPTVQELDNALNATNKPLTFMIVRHPLERLVSGYRDKFLSNTGFYRNISRKIISNYPHYGPPVPISSQANRYYLKRYNSKNLAPSFSQFVQFVIDSWKNNEKLDEHWERMERFCTPCVVDMDVFAKVETLDEDGNFIIFTSGIEKVIKPKRINRSKNGSTNAVADSFLCGLSKSQMKDLVNMYKLDMELFEYDYEKYLQCTKDNQ